MTTADPRRAAVTVLCRALIACAAWLAGSVTECCDAEGHVDLKDVLAVWAETKVDSVSINCEVRTEARRREIVNANGHASGYGASQLRIEDEGRVATHRFLEQWAYLRDDGRGTLLKRTGGGASPAFGKFHPAWAYFKGEGISMFAPPTDQELPPDIVYASRGNDTPAGLSCSLTTRFVLDWIDPRSTANGQHLASLGNLRVEMSEDDDHGDVVMVRVAPNKTVWYAADFHWRPVREITSRGGRPFLEIDYKWKRDGERTVLESVKSREQRPSSGQFCNIDLVVNSFDVGFIADNAFVIKFPRGTVISDSRAEEMRFFVITKTGLEREVSRREMEFSKSGGWSEVIGRDLRPAGDGD